MNYGQAARAVRERVREGVGEAMVEAKPRRRYRGRRGEDMKIAALDGLVDALSDEVIAVARPGGRWAEQLGDMIALQLLSEISRKTAAGNC